MEDAKSPVDRYYEAMEKLDTLLNQGKITLGAYEKETKKLQAALDGTNKELGSVANTGVSAFGPNALSMVKSLAGALGVGTGLAGAVQLARKEYEAFLAVQDRAKQSTLTVAGAEIVALRNLGAKTPKERDDFLTSIEKISSDTGVAQSDLLMRSSEALSARGNLPVSSVLRAIKASAMIAPESQDEGKFLAGASLDIGKITGATPEQAMGYMMVVGEQARVTATGKIAENVAPAMTGAMATGASPQVAGAVWGALTQGINDNEGRIAANASIGLAAELKKYLPEKGEDYSEEQFQKDKRSIVKEREATRQSLRHDVEADPEYLQNVRDIATEKAGLRKKRLRDPDEIANRDMLISGLGERQRIAREAAEERVSQSEKYRDKETQFTLKEQSLEKRREDAKAIVASGFKTEDERIAFLQSHPVEREEFLKKATFEKKADAPIAQLLSGTGPTGEAFAEFKKNLPAVSESEGKFDNYVSIIRGSARQRTATFDRALGAATETIESATEMQPQALMSIVADRLGPILQDVGEPKLLSDLSMLGTQLSGDQIGSARQTVIAKQNDLRNPTRRMVHSGPGYAFAGETIPQEPTKKGVEQADKLDQVIRALDDVRAVIAEGNQDRRSGTNRPALGTHKDPGDRH
jgi:hypothetical protein